MNEKIFSVIIPTYNRAESLRRALRSLVAQTYKNFEVVICDDGSTDHTKKVVESFKNDLEIKYIWEENWGGPARPRNNGIKVASSEWICFLDHDDWWYKNKLKCIVDYVNTSDVIHHGVDIYTMKRRLFHKKVSTMQVQKPAFPFLMKNPTALHTSAVAVKKKILTQLGGFSEDINLKGVEDFDLWLRIAQVTEKIRYIREVLAVYSIDGGNTTEVSDQQVDRIKCVYNKYLGLLNPFDRKEATLRMNYSISRIYQKNGEYSKSYEIFKESKNIKNIEFKIKSILLIILLYFKTKLVKDKNEQQVL